MVEAEGHLKLLLPSTLDAVATKSRMAVRRIPLPSPSPFNDDALPPAPHTIIVDFDARRAVAIIVDFVVVVIVARRHHRRCRHHIQGKRLHPDLTFVLVPEHLF